MSFGGSLIVPDEIDVNYLKKFRAFVKKKLRSYRFIIVPGGGKTARRYMKAAKDLGGKTVDQDWAGIASVDCNAELLRIMFNAPVVAVNEKLPFKPVVIVASGPSLTKKDCRFIERERVKDKIRVIAVNNSWEMVPESDVLYACDLTWWDRYAGSTKDFEGLKYTQTIQAAE